MNKMTEERKKIINSFKYAFEGIKSSLKTERNIKIHFSMMILVIVAGILLDISTYEWMICIILFGMVIGGELVNTAIEEVTDLVTTEINPKAKLAKDIAAGAVLIMAITSAIIGLIIFIPKIILLFK